MRRLFSTLWLASRDYRREWVMSGCFVLALAAVLGPMLVLFGLKSGIVGTMLDELIQDPRNREVRPVSSGSHSRAWLDTLRLRDEVAFVVPRTRSIAASIQLKHPNSPSIVSVEVIPSDRGDPLLGPDQPYPDTIRRIVLSTNAAQKLGARAGDRIDGSLTRQFRGRKQREHVELEVAAVAPPAAFAREGAFASVSLVEALENYRDGREVPELGWAGDRSDEAERSYPGFRLYAASIDDVAALQLELTALGIDVRTRAAEIDTVQRLDRNLSAVFWVIAVIGLTGFSVSLGASLWANVDRKRKDLAILRLVGFRTSDIVWFPTLQSLYTAVLGWAVAVGIYQGVALTINRMMAGQLPAGQEVCRLLPEHFLVSLGLTAGAALVAAGLAGFKAARVAPSEGLREI